MNGTVTPHLVQLLKFPLICQTFVTPARRWPFKVKLKARILIEFYWISCVPMRWEEIDHLLQQIDDCQKGTSCSSQTLSPDAGDNQPEGNLELDADTDSG